MQLKGLSWSEDVLAVQKDSEVRLRLLLGGSVAMPPGRLLKEVIDAGGHLLNAQAPILDPQGSHAVEDPSC